ncbi:MAG: type II toxin-antitoxin system VapB family antitoxin [Gammaproteobacteria bacterium]
MRINIIIDDKLMENALKLSDVKSKREVVELGLKALISMKKQENIRHFKGQIKWEGDLDSIREKR